MRKKKGSMVAVKVGKSFWAYSACEGEMDLEEWVCRSIQTRMNDQRGRGTLVTYAYLVRKVQGLTWGKMSTNAGDYGWEKDIPESCRKKFRVGEDGKIELWGVFSTKLQAAKDELRHCEGMLRWSLECREKMAGENVSEGDRLNLEENIKEDRRNVQAAKANLNKVKTEKKR